MSIKIHEEMMNRFKRAFVSGTNEAVTIGKWLLL